MQRTQQAGDRAGRVAAVVAALTAVLREAVEEHLEAWEQADLRTLEGQVQRVFRRAGGALLGVLAQGRVAAQAGQRPACPRCGGPVRLVDAGRPRFVQGLVGEVTVRRPYYHCAACRQGTAPLDAAWGLGRGSLSPELARVVCRAGVEVPFAQAADLVHEYLGVRLDAEAVRGIGEAMGALVEADQRDPARWAPAADAPVPAILALELDGVMVHEVDAWRELKVGRVARPTWRWGPRPTAWGGRRPPPSGRG